jgi:branched-chain amino acid transport system permease protein
LNSLQTLVDAVNLGAVYALAAIGVGVIFGVMRLINFAHGELISAAAFTAYLLEGQPVWMRVAGALTASFVMALLMERIAFRSIRKASAATLLITSFALSYLLQHLIVLVFGARPLGVSLLPQLSESVRAGELRIPWLELATISSTALILGALLLFFHRSRLGVAMRAAAEDFTMARLVGVRSDRIIAAGFGISGLLAACIGLYLVIQSGTVSYRMGVDIVLVAFVATVVGGMGSLGGAALGGFLVGVTSIALQAFLPESWRPYRDAFLFGLFLAFLILRPGGLMQPRHRREWV